MVITTIVFDIGGVFLHPSQEVSNGLVQSHVFADPAIADYLIYGELWEVYKRGGMTEQAYWEAILEQLPVDYVGTWITLREEYELGVVLDTELVTLARQLKETYSVHALSNAGAELERRLLHFGFHDLFGEVINSHYVKMAKPDAEIYHYTSVLVGASPEEILFVDDKPRNTRVADVMGFHTHVYTSAESLKSYLLQNNLIQQSSA